jgi:hypothetical protein
MPFLLQLPQGFETGASLQSAARIEKPELFADFLCQLRPDQVIGIIDQPTNTGNGLGTRKRPFDLVLSFHAATVHGMKRIVQPSLWVMGSPSPSLPPFGSK